MEDLTTSGGAISPPQVVNASTDEAFLIRVLGCVESVDSTMSLEDSPVWISGDLKLAKKQNRDLDRLFDAINILADGGYSDRKSVV